jgi:hypothetical protein
VIGEQPVHAAAAQLVGEHLRAGVRPDRPRSWAARSAAIPGSRNTAPPVEVRVVL